MGMNALVPSVNAPSPGGVGSQYDQLLQQLIGSAPQQVSAQSTYQPQFTTEQLQNLALELGGGNGTPGYLSIYGNQVVPTITSATTAANTVTRGANVSDLTAMAPAAVSGVEAANPAATKLSNELTSTATGQLDLGAQLDPTTLNQITQSVRSNWASRGLGTSDPAQLDEAVQLYTGGQNLLQQRENEAGQVATMDASLYTDPALSWIGATSGAPQMGQTMTATGQAVGANAGPTLYPTSDLESLMNLVYNAQASANIGQANAQTGIESAMIGASGQMGGSMMGSL